MARLIAANWKMNGTVSFARELAGDLDARARSAPAHAHARAEVALCPPAPLLPVVGAIVKGGPIALGAQDCHAAEKGAHTGDVSARLLADLGCRYVIVGHSERRAGHGETDAVVQAKAKAALAAGLAPIVCVGETEAERARGETAAVIARQVKGSLPAAADGNEIVIAYEPVWAIGTGKTATPADIAAVHARIRALHARDHAADGLRILYGGSVKVANAAAILACEGVDGALVGGASLDAAAFWGIVEACP